MNIVNFKYFCTSKEIYIISKTDANKDKFKAMNLNLWLGGGIMFFIIHLHILIELVLKGYEVMKNIIILTSDGLRHTYMRKALALNHNIRVLRSYCEKSSQLIYDFASDTLQTQHLNFRALSEKDFFENFVELTPDYSNPSFIQKNEINTQEKIDEIIELNPDLIVAYGCSIIKPALIQKFKDKILNVHLGLSPYYRGAGTNYFPFVNNELEYVGATFMYMDEGIDTGEIIHQFQVTIYPGDTLHQIGNRLIGQIAKIYISIINNYDKLPRIEQPLDKKSGKLYKNKDFTTESLEKIYTNFNNNMIENYLFFKKEIKLYQNPLLLDIQKNILQNNF